MIEVQGLSKHFGPNRAVDNLSFKVERGEVLGFLGPNGAGKSTTMKMLTCFLQPTAGTAKVCGFDILTQSMEVRARVGYLAESGPLYSEMTVRDFLRFVAELRQLPDVNAAIDRVLTLCALHNVDYQTIETLSKGYKRRVGLAQALIHDPEVLILDEPTDGLDPNQKFEVRELIKKMAADKCIVLSTHILEEVDAVCTRALVIARGVTKADGKPEDLRRMAPDHDALRLRLRAPATDTLAPFFAGQPGVAKVVEEAALQQYLLYPKNGGPQREALLQALSAQGHDVESCLRLEGRLDSCFRELTKSGSHTA